MICINAYNMAKLPREIEASGQVRHSMYVFATLSAIYLWLNMGGKRSRAYGDRGHGAAHGWLMWSALDDTATPECVNGRSAACNQVLSDDPAAIASILSLPYPSQSLSSHC